MKLKDSVDEWLIAKEIENVSVKTMQIYSSMAGEMVDYLGDIDLKDFEARQVREFLGYQMKREGRHGKLSDATLHKYYSVIRTYCRWLQAQEYKVLAPTDKVKAPKVEEKLPETLSDDELDRLWVYLNARCTFRVRLIFEFFLDTGARLSEVQRLNVKDVNLDNGWCKIYGKGRREEIIPLGKKLTLDMHRYLFDIRPEIVGNLDDDAFFVTKKGTRYTKSGLSTLVKTKLKRVGVEGSYGPHKLRHTYATNFLRNKGGVEQLRRILRHRSVKTTQRYIALLPEDLINAQMVASPLDHLMHRMGQ